MAEKQDKDLYTIVYVSRAIMHFDRYTLNSLLDAVIKNADYGLTGLLFYLDKYFIEVLEHERNKLLRLMKNINDDSRYVDVRIIFESPIKSRLFGNWCMGYVGLNSDKEKIYVYYHA